MTPVSDQTPAHSSFFAEAVALELRELTALLSHLDASSVKEAVSLLGKAERVFLFGAGRSGLALRMAAMRLMHLGLRVHVVGEPTTPAIEKGDLLFVASASGTSTSVLHTAEVAKKAGASVLAITAALSSPLASLASSVLMLPASSKNEFSQRVSEQYAGSLFEQAVLLLTDAIFHGMWQASGVSAALLMQRHANLE